MKIGAMSDLHLEFGEYNGPIGSGDVLVLAGDVHVASLIHSAHPRVLEQKIKDRSVSFLKRALGNYDHVVAVAGNHEHYHGIFNYTGSIINSHFNEYEGFKNFHFLEKGVVAIKGVNFFGTTLWTDFNENNTATRKKAQEYMADYRAIKIYDPRHLHEYRDVEPEDFYQEHLDSVSQLKLAITDAQENDAKLVVVSHHAPSRRSVHPRYQFDYHVNGAYHTNLEHLMCDTIPLWVHGHMHDSFDYRIGNTRVMCNPRGYAGHHLNPHFNPEIAVEI